MYNFALQAYNIVANYGAVDKVLVQIFGSNNVEIVGTRIDSDIAADASATITALNDGDRLNGDARGAMLYVSAPVDLFVNAQHDGIAVATGMTTIASRIEAGWHRLGQLANGALSAPAAGGGDTGSAVPQGGVGNSQNEDVATDSLRVFGSADWTGTGATSNSNRDRYVQLTNSDEDNKLFYELAVADDADNEHATVNSHALNRDGASTSIFVPAGQDLFVVRATAGGNVKAHEVLV